MNRKIRKLVRTAFYQKSAMLFFMLSLTFSSYSQRPPFLTILNTEQDTNYVVNYSDKLTTRIYTSNKFANFTLLDTKENHSLRYRPNDNWNLGVGFNYSIVGINLGINFPFINNDNATYGKSKFLDLQSHIYTPKLAVDFIGQFYKGFYLENSDILIDQPTNQYYIRPDIAITSLGLSALYIFNDKKFSYRAFFLQNEWQKKSAGSFLLGGGILGVSCRGDSSLFPDRIPFGSFFDRLEFDKISNWKIAVNGGYAHTFVVKSNWFFSLSLTAGTGWGASTIHSEDLAEKERKFVLNAYGTSRWGIGYNSARFFSGVSFVFQVFVTPTPLDHSLYQFSTGNFRANIAYRFNASFLRKKIKEIDPKNELFLPNQ